MAKSQMEKDDVFRCMLDDSIIDEDKRVLVYYAEVCFDVLDCYRIDHNHVAVCECFDACVGSR